MGESKSDKVKNSLTPVWNHETTLDLQKTSPRMIEIQLMDWERIGKDEPMGKVVLPVGEAVKKSSKGSFWLDLQDCTSGKILISTEFNRSGAKGNVGGGAKELRGLLKSDSSKDPKPDKADVEAGSNQQCELAPQVDPAASRVEEQTKEKTTNDQTKKSVAKKAGSTAKGEAAGITTEEADRIAAEKARIAAEEEAKTAAEKEAAEKARIAAEEEEARIAAERDTAEKARLAAEEETRIATEKEAAEKARIAAAEEEAKIAAEKARIAAEEEEVRIATEKEAAEKARIAAEEEEAR